MFLYNLTLNPATAINQAIIGNFSGTKIQEIIVARHTRLELLRPEATTGKVHIVLAQETFGIVRSLSPFRLTGGSKGRLWGINDKRAHRTPRTMKEVEIPAYHYVVVGSDSGRIVILEYNPAKNTFDKVHQETYGKSGVRRIVPGQYLATDPKGRAVMIGAVEKQKLVYILNRDSAARLTISSPLEAHKSHTLVHSCVGLDVGFENPVFACLEVDYSEADNDATGEGFQNTEKMLTYYELDLGLNHVVRKWSDPVDPRANLLIPVPGGTDGPSGVLVCTENFISYRHQDAPEYRVPIPRRAQPLEDASRGLLICSGVVHKMKVHKQQQFFFLLQSEEGDIYKVTMEHRDGKVKAITIKYFDTVPVSAGLCILKSGFLFVASEFGNQIYWVELEERGAYMMRQGLLYSFEHLGDDPEDPEYNSSDFMQEDGDGELPLVYFKPRPLKNLAAVDELESLSPLMDSKIVNLTEEDTPQIYALSGRGARSTFRVLKHGLQVTELAVSDLPGNPSAVWTTKLKADDINDAYIVVSFANATLVLSIGETVEEVSDTGFLGSTPTLGVEQLGDDALIQIYPQGIRHIRADRRVNEWKTPGGKTVVHAATNHRQVVIALTGGELVYFELDNAGQLNEHQERKEMNAGVTALSLGDVPEGRQRSRFLAVGCDDDTVRVLSLDPDSCLESLSMQAVQGAPSSLCIVEMMDSGADRSHGTQYLNIGLTNGVLLRTVLDEVTGQLSDTRTRFIGSKAVKLFKVKVQGNKAVLALSTRPWLSYTVQARLYLTPLSYDMVEYGSGFKSEQVPEGVVAIAGSTLRYTPRHFALHQQSKNFVLIESEHNAFSPVAKQKAYEAKAEEGFEIDEDIVNLPEETFGLIRAEPGKWASLIRLLNPLTLETLQTIELEENEAAFSIAIVSFLAQQNEPFLVVGTGKDVNLAPRTCSAGFIHVYRFVEEGTKLELYHKTQVDDVPLALLGFQGRLLAGVGKALRIYDLGKRKLLRKCESKLTTWPSIPLKQSVPNCIVSLHTQGDRIVIGDIQESVHYATYKHRDNRILVFADDTQPRWLTTSIMVDYDTVAGGDKFGNFFIDRLPSATSEEVDEDPTGNRILVGGILFVRHGKPGAEDNQRLCLAVQYISHYYVGDIMTSLHRSTLVSGGREILVYTTFLGSIGVFIPFITKEDVDFFQTLEMHMRSEAPPLTGRDHLSYRSYYTPVKSVVDGDLCEGYVLLPAEKKRMIAEELDRTVQEVTKKIEDMRVRAAF
ncbi:CPSF A subunit region-domain-containing protein [Jimgerdemannia flammicorona]|uniref:CPSF A subunit region-domain-containing protein n=1 Tax=Jimgerdemannia flammicorona TaxID=994334 RepID=A0A433QAD2_9FUNG|nr:CPSF A subunit region-domain-containing protein [Jimgerdemannia flammicorona]